MKFGHLLGFTLALGLAAPTSASLVNITSITYTGTAPVESGINLGDANNLINGSGLSAALTEANIDTVTHAGPSFSAPGNAWTTNSPGGDFFAAPTGTVVFEIIFDETYNLTNFYNWSYDFDEANRNGNNIRNVTIEYGVGDFANSTGPIELTTLPGNDQSSNTPLAIEADRVRITVNDNYFGVAGFQGGDRVSAAEFAFLGTPLSADPILTSPAGITVNNNGSVETVQVTLTNDGATQTLSITDAEVVGTDAAGFTVLTDLTTPLDIAPGGGTGIIEIEVDPANLPGPGVPFIDTFLEIDSNDTVSPPTRSIPIDGIVRDPWMVVVESVDLGTLNPSAGVQNFTIDVQNLGTSDLTVDDGFFIGGSGFSVVDDLITTPLVISGGQTAQVNLSFDPTGIVGEVSSTLELAGDDPVTFGNSVAYTVTVEHDPQISVTSPTTFSFTGLGPQSLTVTLGNAGASNNLTISSVTDSSGDTANFTVDTFDSPIVPAGSGDIDLTFDPLGLYGNYSVILEIQSNDQAASITEVELKVQVAPVTPMPFSPASVDDTAADSFANAAYAAGNLINGGFVATLDDAPAGANNWVSNSSGTDYFDLATPPVLVFDLGSDADVRLLYLWAYSEGTTFGGDRQANSIRDFSLRFATAADGPTGFGTTIALNPSFTADPAEPTTAPAGPGAVDQPVQIFDFGTTVTARYVEVTLTDNHFGFPGNDGGDRVGLNEIAFDGLGSAPGSPFNDWIAGFPELTGDDALPGSDPDGDGIDNEGEFGFDGNPDNASDKGKVFLVVADGDDTPDSDDELILTVAMRTGANFPASGAPLVSDAIDGIVYQVEGSTDLAAFATQVNLETTAVGTAGLPTPSTGWEYRSFSLDGSNGLPDTGFLRAGVAADTP